MNTHATGTFEVILTPAAPESGRDLPARLLIDKRFEGDLVATSRGQMLSALTTTPGSAGYVAIEQVTGTLHGRHGSFALQHYGLMDRGAPQLIVSVIPDSGTDELSGLTGGMRIQTQGGHRYEFDYDLVGDTVVLPDAPPVPGLMFRRLRQPEDHSAIASLVNASNEADGTGWVVTGEEMAAWLGHRVNCDLLRDLLLAEVEGEIVGMADGHWRVQVSGVYRYNLNLLLAPAWRGRGIRRVMLRWLEARMRRVATEHPAESPKLLALKVPEQAKDARALLESHGYEVTRYYLNMVRSLAEPIPDFPLPPGLELRPVLPEHYRPIWDASNEAFLDHWGYSIRPESYYELWRTNPVTFTPELWQVAWDVENNEIAGQVQTFINAQENERHNRRRGYSEVISVRRPYRRRGLARALVAESLRTLKARGMTESALLVDAENVSGATRLYEACGFGTASRLLAYGKALDPQ